MRILIQRVKEARVDVEKRTIGKIGNGLLVFLGIHPKDTPDDCLWLKDKLIHLRIFSDSNHKLNLSLLDVKGELLIVSQFTLYADCSRGRRPSFVNAAPPEMAKNLYEQFIQELKSSTLKIETGQFGAHMEISLINDGPLTFLIDSRDKTPERP